LQATIQLSAIGGVAPYQYSTDGVNFTNTTTYTVGAGIYQYYVRDANGCKAVLTNQVEIEAIPTLVVGLDLSAAVINCSGDTSATIRATATGGLGNYSYTLLDSANNPIGVAQATGVFSNLAAGLYSVAVQSGDCNAVSTPITITDPPLLEVIKPVIKTDITCFGESNGSITINTTGGTGIIQYAISPNLNQFFTKNTFTDLGPGTYRILVQDQAGCFELVDVTINEPAALAATFVVDQLELCTGDANGAVTVSITGGTAPYATSIDSNNPGDYVVGKTSFTGLTGGQLYTIFVKDANNCETAVFVTLAPAVTVTILDAKVTYNCTTNLPGNTVTVTVNPEVLSSVQYSADGVVYQASNVLVNLPVGTQTIYVRHTNGCIKSVVVDILPKLPIIAAVSSIQAATCNGSATGTLTVTATGGTGALQYAISPSYVYQTANVFANLAAGTYTVRVKDDLGCEVTIGNNNVTEPSLVVATIVNAVQELCTNDANGSIEIAVAGGTAPYYTSINSNNPADFVQGKLLYTNLVGGTTYVIYVKDQNGCTTATPFTYTLNPSVDLQATTNVVVNCTGNTPGNVVTVSINPTINPASVTYALDGGAFLSTSVYTNVAVGPHSVVVRHTNGCQTTLNFTIAPVVPIAASATPQVVGCFGEATGSVSISATGGQGVLQYGISPNYVLSPNPTFANLAAGNYTVRVEDALGCFQLVPFTISQPTQLQTTLVMKMEEICDGDSDGMIEIAVTGGTAPYYTSLDPNGNFVQDLYLYDQLEGGQDYTIYVKDANGCLTQIKVTLQAPVVIDAKADVVFDCTSNVVTIQVDPSSIGNVRYSINGGALQTSNVFPALVDGDYVVDVIHNNGVCSSSVSFTIENPIPLTLTLAQTGLNEITATAKGGNGGYQYTFDGISNGTDNTYIINYSGNHEVTVTDAKGCTAKAEIKMDFIDIEIPNNFTPDGNEFNDTWAPLNTANYPNLTVAIFDRYGRKVATLGVNQSWDGTYNGEPLPTGDYWYVIKLGAANDDREFVGNFTLYR
jgi:gliding motility-associated-like protein